MKVRSLALLCAIAGPAIARESTAHFDAAGQFVTEGPFVCGPARFPCDLDLDADGDPDFKPSTSLRIDDGDGVFSDAITPAFPTPPPGATWSYSGFPGACPVPVPRARAPR